MSDENEVGQETSSDATDESAGGSLYDKASRHRLVVGSLMLVGAGLAYAAARKITRSDEGSNVARDVHVKTSITIAKSPAELFAFWRDFTNLPRFMRNLESVTVSDQWHSHWVAKGIAGSLVEWDAEIHSEKENELIVWRSLENADVVNAGSVRFQPGPEGHGTYVRVTVNYNTPTGKVGESLAQFLRAEPANLIKEDLRRFKQIMEAGEIATIAGQSSGRAAESESVAKPKAKAARMGGPDSIRENESTGTQSG